MTCTELLIKVMLSVVWDSFISPNIKPMMPQNELKQTLDILLYFLPAAFGVFWVGYVLF